MSVFMAVVTYLVTHPGRDINNGLVGEPHLRL